jgi:SAM-dependent methyltransferase
MPDQLGLFKMFLAERRDPLPFYERLATEAVEGIPFSMAGSRVLDLGCGPGHYTRALRAAGAQVIPVDLSPEEFLLEGGPPGGEIVASGMDLPFADGSFDGLLCSNMIEHTPDPVAVLDEIERILKPGGWAWISWTNWYSPWGGHDISPFHYLGPRLGLRTYRRVAGREPKNVPLQSLYPLHIGPTLRGLRTRPGFRILDARPRYYPTQRWILRVPGFRELATWNCLLLLERNPDEVELAS